MRLAGFLPILFGMALTAVPARAQGHKVEIGTSLVGAAFGLGEDDTSTFGVPAAGFFAVSPALYTSIFVAPRLAIEPQIGLQFVHSSQGSYHYVNLAGQVDYFLRNKSVDSPYLFGTVGVFDITDSDSTPVSVGGGAGYRILAGGRLTFRIDGRFVHYTDDGGNSITFGLSIGGLF